MHLAGVEERRPALLGHPQGDGEREGALPAPDVTPEHDQIAAAQPAPEQLVEAREAGWDGVGGAGPVRDGVHSAEQEGEGGYVSTAWHCPRYGPFSERSKEVPLEAIGSDARRG